MFVSRDDWGVTVASLDGDKLIEEKTLTCVSYASSVGVISQDTVYVCNQLQGHEQQNAGVYLVDVKQDETQDKDRLIAPGPVRDPLSVAVLQDRILVIYTGSMLALYSHGNPKPDVITSLEGLGNMSAATTDGDCHFLITDRKSQSIFVVDVNGDLRHTVKVDTDSMVVDCAVVNGQLWVACENGDIVIMSSG